MTTSELGSIFDKALAENLGKYVELPNVVRKCYDGYMQIEINSKKYGRKIVLIDEDDTKLIIGNSLHLSHSGQFLYVKLSPSKQYLHRLLTKAPKGMVVDHINRNTLDNRRSNLRVVTIQQNLQNQKRPNNKTGYTGVAIGWNGKFTAQIKVDYKKIHLGIFSTIEDAYKARKKAEKLYFKYDNS